MVEVYANLIIEGRLNFNRVPDRIKEKVREFLIEKHYEELVTD